MRPSVYFEIVPLRIFVAITKFLVGAYQLELNVLLGSHPHEADGQPSSDVTAACGPVSGHPSPLMSLVVVASPVKQL
jgi:hypothetical protein